MGVVGSVFLADAQSGAPSYTGRLSRQGLSALLAGASAARPFGGITGVRPGTSITTVTATSTTWSCAIFGGVIDLEASNLSGAFPFMFNLATSGAVTASNSGNPRIDILSVRVNDTTEADGTPAGTAPFADLVYTAGVASGSPVAPATPARTFAIAQFNFPAGVGTTPTVTWVAPYTASAGGIVPAISPTFYPAAATYPGQYLDDLSTGVLSRSNGSAWLPVGSGRVIPTASSGTIDPVTGKVTFATSSSVTVDVAQFTDDEDYEFVLDVTATSATTVVTCVLRAAGANLTAASTYDFQNMYGVTSVNGAGQNTSASWQLASTATLLYSRFNLAGLGQARGKVGHMLTYGTQNPQTAPSLFSQGIQFRPSTVITGIGFIFTGGTATGSIRIRRRNV